MTTNDPFASPPGGPENAPANAPTPDVAPPAAAPPAPAQPATPGVLVPGAAPGLLVPSGVPSAPPAPPVGGFSAQTGPPPVAPKGLATWAIVLTGAYTLLSILIAILTPQSVENLKDTLADPENASFDVVSSGLGLLGNVVAIAAFVFLALWMARIRANRTQLGETPGGPPAVEWWGWFVPIANFVLPLLGMRAISRRLVGWGLLLCWWVPFAAMWLVLPFVISAQFRAIDLSTGELTNPEILDQTIAATWVSTALLTISWLFLVVIIRKTTAKHLDR